MQPSATQPSHLSHFPSTSGKPPSRRPCTYCGSLYHYSENCPLHLFHASHRIPLLTNPTSGTQPPPPYPSSNALTSSGTLSNQPLPYACRDFNNSCAADAHGTSTTCAGDAVMQPMGSGTVPLPVDQQRLVPPIQMLELEHELASHPDKGFVSQLLSNLRHGCSIGYEGPHFPHPARHMPSAYIHAHIISASLAKECSAARIAGPYTNPLFQTCVAQA